MGGVIDWVTDDVLGFDPPAGDVSPGQLLEQQAQYSFVNQNNPYGSLSYQKDPTTGYMTQNYQPSAFQDFLRQGQEDITANLYGNAQAQIGGLPTAPMNTSGLRGWGDTMEAGQGLGPNFINDVAQSTYDYQMNLASPYFDQQDARFNQDMVNRGIDPTSELGQRLSTQYGDQRTRDVNQMTDRAFQQALGAQGQIFDQSKTAGAFDNMTRQAQFGEQAGLRNQQYSEIANLLGLAPQQYQSPGFFGPSGTPNVAGAYQTALQGQQANDSYQGNVLGAIGGLLTPQWGSGGNQFIWDWIL